MSQLTARPTEYKGIKYKSKSEAMFARWLELWLSECSSLNAYRGPLFDGNSQVQDVGFVYEPDGWEVDGWVPDFLVAKTALRMLNKLQVPILFYEVIEYKPSRPTNTYVAEFNERCKELYKKLIELEMADVAYRTTYHIYYGSVFNIDRGWIDIWLGDLQWHKGEDADWLVDYEDEIKATRFDLHAANL